MEALVKGNVREITTASGEVVLVDVDVELPGSVCMTGRGYATIWVDGRNEYLHRWLLGLERGDGKEIDHVNGDPLDNRRVNLRIVDRSTNQLNRSIKGKGYTWNRAAAKWEARPDHLGRKHLLGYFDNEEEAAAAVAVFRRENRIVHLRFIH